MTGLIPVGWQVGSLERVVRSSGGGTPSKADSRYWTGGTIPWVSPKDMKTFVIGASEDEVTEKALERLSLIPVGSVLMVVRSGILSRTLPVAITSAPVTINQDIRAFTPEPGVLAKYVAWQLIAKEHELLRECSKHGTTVASMEGPALLRFPLWIAPSNEQILIVAKLEELLSDLDAGVAELKAAQRKLAQYRQSLLKAAVEGALTAEWRAQHTPTETGAQLLERILTERRARWEANQLAKVKDQGKTPPAGWQKKYVEPVQPDMTDLPVLPQGWVWASGEQLCEFIKGTTPAKDLDIGRDKAIPFLRVTNLTDRGELDLNDEVFVSLKTHRGFLARSAVYPNDVLMNIVGPPLGQVAVVPALFSEWNINQAIAIFRAVDGVLPWFMCRYLLSPVAQRWLKARSKTTAGQTNLTLEVCRSLPIPLPPQAEQRELLGSLELVMSSIAWQGQAIAHALHQSTAQRQNILRAAFAGQLVPQDPNDEPASRLLARIRAERAANGKPAKARKSRAAKEPA